jgi:hypothetical protein
VLGVRWCGSKQVVSVVVVAAFLCSLGVEGAATLRGPSSEFDCGAVGAQMDDCFTVRGWIRVTNGSPSVRISPRDSRRVFGVPGGADGGEFSPPEIRRLYSFDHSIWGDVRVCPLEADRPGAMRPVCIAQVDRWSIVAYR